MRKQSLFFMSLAFFFLVFISSCQKELEEQLKESASKEAAHYDIQQLFKDYPDSALIRDMLVQWDKAELVEKEGEQLKVYPVELKNQRFHGGRENGIEIIYKIMGLNKSFGSEFLLLEIMPSVILEGKDVSLSNVKDFSGIMQTYNRYGQIQQATYYQEGEIISDVDAEELKQIAEKKEGERAPDCGKWAVQTVEHYLDWYHSVNGGPWSYTWTQYNGKTYNYVYVDCGQPENYYVEKHVRKDVPHVPGGSLPEYYREQVISNQLYGVSLCIWDRFKNADAVLPHIRKFDGEFPDAHLRLEVFNGLRANVYASTKKPENYWITLQISNTNMSGISDLGRATAIAHELIHAEIYSMLLVAARRGDLNIGNMTKEEQVNYVNTIRERFNDLYHYYKTYKNENWDHYMMADKYRNTIADMIQDFDGNRLSRQTYLDLAWAGLREYKDTPPSPAWNALSEAEKTRIKTVLATHFFNGPKVCQ